MDIEREKYLKLYDEYRRYGQVIHDENFPAINTRCQWISYKDETICFFLKDGDVVGAVRKEK